MQERRVSSRLDRAARTVGLTLFFLVVAGLFLGGVLYVFFPGGHSSVLGSVFLAISVPIMFLEAKRWVRALPGIFGVAVLNGLISLWTGHAVNDPSQPVSRLRTMTIIWFFAVCAVLSDKLRRQELLILDRLALIVFAFSFSFWIGYDSARTQERGSLAFFDLTELIAMGIGLLSLLLASLHSRKRRVTSPVERQNRPL